MTYTFEFSNCLRFRRMEVCPQIFNTNVFDVLNNLYTKINTDLLYRYLGFMLQKVLAENLKPSKSISLLNSK